MGFGNKPSAQDLQRLELLEELRQLQTEMHNMREDLARLTEATQNDEASKTHREALHAALIMMDRRINGRPL